MRDIRKIKENFPLYSHNFIQDTYLSKQNKVLIKYNISEEGYILLNGRYQLTNKNIANLLYIIKHKAIDDYYKIGITKDLNERLKQLNTSSPTGVEVVFTYKSNKARSLESSIHNKLKEKNTNGEWFRLDKEEVEILVRELNTSK